MIKLGQQSDAKDLRPRVIGVGVFFIAGLLVLSGSFGALAAFTAQVVHGPPARTGPKHGEF